MSNIQKSVGGKKFRIKLRGDHRDIHLSMTMDSNAEMNNEVNALNRT